MKATGIVRRMDDLGRVVVPKELRRTMKISEGTPLEIFIDKDGSIIFRKYSPVGELNESAKNMAECISSGEDTVLAAEGGLRTANAAFPISCAGDLCGMFLLIKDEDAKPGETQEHLRLGKLASDFLSRETVE